MSSLFQYKETDAPLLVSRSSPSTQKTRAAARYNTRVLCPAKFVISTYRAPARLFLKGSKQLISAKGPTHDDPLAMHVYALSLQPLICRLEVVSQAKQWWLADDATRCGLIQNIRVCSNAEKRWLDTNSKHARSIFEETATKITIEGRKLLGWAPGPTLSSS